MQGKKMRAIDDFSISGVNGTLSAAETICPADVDQIAANARAHAAALLQDEPHGTHSYLRGTRRHQDWAGSKLVMRMWDIAAAFKHLAVRLDHRKLGVICVWDPDERVVKCF